MYYIVSLYIYLLAGHFEAVFLVAVHFLSIVPWVPTHTVDDSKTFEVTSYYTEQILFGMGESKADRTKGPFVFTTDKLLDSLTNSLYSDNQG